MRKRQRERQRIIKRFNAMVSTVPNEKGCTPWLGHTKPNGYGGFTLWEGTSVLAHQVAYAIAKQEPFDSLRTVGDKQGSMKRVLRHVCHNKLCMTVGPKHIVRGTQRENIDDNVSAGKILHGEQVGTAKLTEVQVLQIVAEYAAWPRSELTGKPMRGVLARLAEKHGVTRQMIWQIVHEKWWRHLM